MVTTLDLIRERQRKLKQTRIEFEELEDGDCLVTNGKYKNMKLSDVFIVNPAFIEWLIDDDRFPVGARMCARTLKEESVSFSGSVMREIITQ